MFLRCSRCGGQIDAEAGLCSTCGLRLGDEPSPVHDSPEIDVDSGLTDSEAWTSSEADSSFADSDSAVVAMDSMQRALELTGVTDAGRHMAHVIPSLRPGIDLAQAGLTPFEGYLLSLVDGQTSVHDIMEMSGLTLFEAVTAMSSLHEKGILDIDERAPVQTVAPSSMLAPVADDSAALSRLALKKAAAAPSRVAAVEGDPDVLLEQAEDAVAAADLDRARELVRLALVHAPNSERALAWQVTLKDPTHAAERAKVLHGLAVRAYQQGDHATAVRLLEAALDEHEPLAAVHHRLGLALLRAHFDLEKAETHLRRALSLDPDNEKYQRNLERVRRHRGASHNG
ncbi:MAG: hypothetical protein ABIJ09_25505 [Pseudomonadota bacterium]